jgi:glutamate carboxypeptidase
VLLLGHLDTVWAAGTLARMPFKVTRERISGPGVLDMKAGVVMALTAVEVLMELRSLRRPVTLLIHGDEEVGSPVSRKLTEAIARRSEAVYVLEPAQGDAGAYKTARKGVGLYRLAVKGVAAHSGVDFEQGHSAVLELARQIEVLQSMTDLSRGITVNPGVMAGGTCSNVIAAEAWVEIDVRIAKAKDVARVERMMGSLKPFDGKCSLTMTGGFNRPPMERSKGTVALFRRAREFAVEAGIALEEAATGGASDGNFTAALGVPTLDGMGAVGAGAHAPHEHLMRKHLVPRTALLAAMLM